MKKKIISRILAAVAVAAMLAAAIVPASAASDLQLLANPQQPVFAEGERAEFAVKAKGDQVTFEWYVIYEGHTYPTSAVTNQPWKWHLEEGSYGASEDGASFIFESIPAELDGMKIYCVVRSGDKEIKSYEATVNVKKNAPAPPAISVPISYTFANVGFVNVKCTVAEDADKCEYLWLESTDGDLANATELPLQDDATLVADGKMNATRYFICRVTDADGGVSYSSAVRVMTSWDPTQTTPAPETTAPAPETTVPASDTSAPPADSEPSGDDTTSAPDAPTDTTVPQTGDTTPADADVTTSPAPESTTDAAEEGGCGSSLALAALPALALAAFAMRRKEK